MKHIVITGASSDIAQACIREFASKNYNITLLGRNLSRLEKLIQDIRQKFNTNLAIHEVDHHDSESVLTVIKSLESPIDVLLCAQGVMHSNDNCINDAGLTVDMIRTNFESNVIIINAIFKHMKMQGHGKIMAISSVAGIRGRKSNFIYGSTKAALSTFLSGLRALGKEHSIEVIDIKPGFVSTKMTVGIDLPNILTTSPEALARRIYKQGAIGRSKIIYSLPIWRLIALIIKFLPRFILDKMKR